MKMSQEILEQIDACQNEIDAINEKAILRKTVAVEIKFQIYLHLLLLRMYPLLVVQIEQIEKLTAIGVETLEQINNLTVAQLNELGLSISQIHEIQLNALNIQKLGLINQNTTSTSTFTTTSTITTTSTTTTSLSTDVKSEISSPTKDEPPSDSLSNVLDIDMRCRSSTIGSLKD